MSDFCRSLYMILLAVRVSQNTTWIQQTFGVHRYPSLVSCGKDIPVPLIISWCSCHLTVKRRVLNVEQKLITLPEHLDSPPVLSGVRVAQSSVFCVMFCRSLFVLFLLVIVLSVLRSTASDCPFLVSSNLSYSIVIFTTSSVVIATN